MGNMSYCRFRNTFMDVKDCIYALDDMMNNNEKLDKDEYKACYRMFSYILDFFIQNGIVEDNEEMDIRFDEFFNNLNKEEDK